MYCKLTLRQAAKSASGMMKGTRAFNYLLMLTLSAIVISVEIIIGIVWLALKGPQAFLDHHHHSHGHAFNWFHQGASNAMPAFFHSLSFILGGFITVFVVLFLLQVWQYTMTARLWQDKVLVRDFFKNFSKGLRLLPMVFIYAVVMSLYAASIIYVRYHPGLLAVLLWIVMIFVVLGSVLASHIYSTYASATSLPVSGLFQVVFKNKGAMRSLLSVFWCKIKLALVVLVAILLAVLIICGIGALLGMLIPGSSAMLVLNIIIIIAASVLGLFVMFVMFYWVYPFLWAYPLAAYAQVVEPNIVAYDLPAEPLLLEKIKAKAQEKESSEGSL